MKEQINYNEFDNIDLLSGVLCVFRNLLKITWEPVVGIRLYPEPDEPVNILNIKRGIISALNVPVVEENNNIMVGQVFLRSALLHRGKVREKLMYIFPFPH